jgi:hypothetical protein
MMAKCDFVVHMAFTVNLDTIKRSTFEDEVAYYCTVALRLLTSKDFAHDSGSKEQFMLLMFQINRECIVKISSIRDSFGDVGDLLTAFFDTLLMWYCKVSSPSVATLARCTQHSYVRLQTQSLADKVKELVFPEPMVLPRLEFEASDLSVLINNAINLTETHRNVVTTRTPVTYPDIWFVQPIEPVDMIDPKELSWQRTRLACVFNPNSMHIGPYEYRVEAFCNYVNNNHWTCAVRVEDSDKFKLIDGEYVSTIVVNTPYSSPDVRFLLLRRVR